MALTDTVSVSVAMVPDEGVIVIQGALSVAVHVLCLVRLDESTTVCGDGSVPPLVAEKLRALGLTCKAHDGLAKPRSSANVNMVPQSMLDIVCLIGAVHRSGLIILVVLIDMNPIRYILFHRRGNRRWLSRDKAMPVPERFSLAQQANALLGWGVRGAVGANTQLEGSG